MTMAELARQLQARQAALRVRYTGGRWKASIDRVQMFGPAKGKVRSLLGFGPTVEMAIGRALTQLDSTCKVSS